MMPDPDQYNILLDTLRRAKAHLEKAEDDKTRLELAFHSLQAVMTFLRQDQDALDEKLTEPLGLLVSAVGDALQGAKPSLFKHSPVRSRPTETSAESAQASVAFALELAHSAGKSIDAASKWVANQLKKEGVTCADGSAVDARQIITWRKEITAERAPKAARELYGRLRRSPTEYAAAINLPKSAADKQRRCLVLAAAIIKACKATMPQSLPARSRR